jgi:hypothetical protein
MWSTTRATGPRKLLASLLFGLLALALPAKSMAADIACPDANVVVSEWTHDDATEICAVIAGALDLLRAMGIALSDKLVVRPLGVQGAAFDGHSIARYDARTNEIHLLPHDVALRSFEAGPQAFGLPMTRVLWRSRIAHETAHAAAEPHFAPRIPKAAASEYIANVIQLMSLPDAMRDRVLDNYRNLAAWGSEHEVSMTYYFLDPSAFAVKSYRHYMAIPQADRPDFIQRLLRRGLQD